MFIVASCGDSDPPEETMTDPCEEQTTIEGSVTLNGDEQKLILAQLVASSPGANFDDRYSFTIISTSNDCSELTTLSLNIKAGQGSEFSGEYPITDFFETDTNTATGRVMTQQITPVTITSLDMESGTVTVVNKGDNNFDLTIEADLVGGSTLSFEMSHTF